MFVLIPTLGFHYSSNYDIKFYKQNQELINVTSYEK